jgi:TPP-dependent pyruvate/acetoin dehydrogenase alpha subunit
LRGYGIPGIRVDGNDLLAVVKVTRDAVVRARKGGGPTFIEAVTYRRHGHSSSDDPTRYRDPNEVEVWEKRDPVERMRRFLEKQRLWDAAAEERELAEQNELVTREIQTAEKAAPPALDTLIEDVTEHVRPHLREQLAEVRPFFEEGKTAEGAFPL